jgi:hypothetical protein
LTAAFIILCGGVVVVRGGGCGIPPPATVSGYSPPYLQHPLVSTVKIEEQYYHKQPESFGHLNYFWSLRFHIC